VFSDDRNGNYLFLDQNQVLTESVLVGQQLDDLPQQCFPETLTQSSDHDGQFTSLTLSEPAPVDLPGNSTISPEDSLGYSNMSLDLGDTMSLDPLITNLEHQESLHQVPPIEELVSPGVAAMRDSNESAKKPRYKAAL